MQNWHWFALGIGVGYVLARRGGGAGFGLSFSTGAHVDGASQGRDEGFLASGAGMTPLDEPHGSMPYAEVGTWDAQLPGGFPTYPDPGDETRIVNGGPIQ
jgi:hypothetical protein